ncbi:S8 family peptidase [Cognatiyoonia sp. IB215182]|uniref:S8 family peptidase n=1 Tax=Cognatiyoonia sp. IB215182 TaxID=3097353 RepID=UPI002A0D7A60|nr:S8 family peptidase [Cognatiyoonia sp. IB215182]MDX8355789.1 S8 family peptidase [Cognatiyoonia sp. IB215182]
MFRTPLIIAMLIATATSAVAQPAQNLRPVPPAEAYTLPDDTPVESVTIKFREGSAVRLDGTRLTAMERTAREQQALRDGRLTEGDVSSALATVNRLAAGTAGVALEAARPTFTASVDELRARREAGERRSGRTLADLTLYTTLPLAEGTVYGDVAGFLREINALAIVEVAYATPPATDPQADAPPPTPDFALQQGYLDAAPVGIDARYAWTIPGGTGSGVRIIDVEQGINVSHEDLPPLFSVGGQIRPGANNRDHGTAVMGVLVAADNGYGITGIAHGAEAGFESHFGPPTDADAFNAAAAQLDAGDIILIEIQRTGPANGQTCPAGCGACAEDAIAIEFWQANFDAIETATANGIVVVQAAGNGRSDFDDPAYGGLFDRTMRDSGAIIVGAGTSDTREPTCFSNFGERVDLQGWGENVATLGYGTLFDGIGPPDGQNGVGLVNQRYTGGFNGTSSASPIVAGAAAAVQGAVIAAGGDPLTSTEMREVLQAGATPQAPDVRNIGPLPNLRGAIDAALHPECALPATGDWIVSETCVVSQNRSAPAGVQVQDDARLIVLPRVTLDLPFQQHALQVQPAGQVLVHPDGRIR